MAHETSTVQATQTSFEVLRTLRENGGAGVTEVADSLDIPKSTAHKHLHTLVRLGYATNNDGTYDVSLSLVEFGQYARTRNPLFQAAKPAVDKLAETTGDNSGLYIEHGGYGFDVYQSEGENGREHTIPRHLHCTAPGKAILAELPDDRVDDIITRHGLPTSTEQTITDVETLATELKRIRDRGIAFDREESRQGIHGVSVPVIHNRTVRGAIYVMGAQSDLTGKWFDENIPGIILSSVNRVEQRLRE